MRRVSSFWPKTPRFTRFFGVSERRRRRFPGSAPAALLPVGTLLRKPWCFWPEIRILPRRPPSCLVGSRLALVLFRSVPPCAAPHPPRTPRTLAPPLPPFAFAPSRRPALLRSISHLLPPSPRRARCLACPAKPSPGLTASLPRYARSVPLRSALCPSLPSCLILTSHPRTLASLPRPILFCFALPSLRPASPRRPPPRYARSASPSGRRRCPALPVPLPPLCLALRRLVPVPPPHLTSAVAFPSPRQARCLACPANPSSGLASLSAPRLPSSRTNLPIPPAPLVPFPLSRTRLPIPPAPLAPPSRLASATAPAPHRPPSPPNIPHTFDDFATRRRPSCPSPTGGRPHFPRWASVAALPAAGEGLSDARPGCLCVAKSSKVCRNPVRPRRLRQPRRLRRMVVPSTMRGNEQGVDFCS